MTKEDFRAVDRRALLDKVAALRVRDSKMKDQNDGTRHIGPVAQDFHRAFGYGGTETGINLAAFDVQYVRSGNAHKSHLPFRCKFGHLYQRQLQAIGLVGALQL